jgi:hypothetical protein
MELTTLIILHSLERILAVLIGFVFSYLGYRLFLAVPTQQNSEGEFNLPGGTSIHLLRVGPGVFFSLFGASIVLASFINPISFKEKLPTALNVASSESQPAREVEYLGAGSGESVDTDKMKRRDLRSLRQRDIVVLNRLSEQLRADLDPKQRAYIEVAIPRIKLALMESVWIEDDWGSLVAFRKAIDTGDALTAKNQDAMKYYDQK